jgi:hypothetical protein
MPTIEFASKSLDAVKADTIAVFAGKGDDRARPGADAEALGRKLGLDLADELEALRYRGDLGEIARIPTRGKARAGVALVVGLGEPDKATLETLRRAAGSQFDPGKAIIRREADKILAWVGDFSAFLPWAGKSPEGLRG